MPSLSEERRQLLETIAMGSVVFDPQPFKRRIDGEWASELERLSQKTPGEIINEKARKAHDLMQQAERAKGKDKKRLRKEARAVWTS